MQINTNVENRDESAGDFFHHGACTIPVHADAEIAKCHASTFGCTLADRMSNIHTYSTLQGSGKMTECPMIKFKGSAL